MELSRYKDLFVSEARSHIDALSSLSIRCEEGAIAPDIINEMFRHAHSLKGMSATMQFTPITTLSHALEDLMAGLRDGRASITRGTVDLMLTAIDTLAQLVALAAQGAELPDTEALARNVRSNTPATDIAPQAPLKTESGVPLNTESTYSFRASDDTTTTRIKTALLDRLVTLSGELLTVRHSLEAVMCTSAAEELGQPLKELSALLRQLRDEVFQARMLPASAITERFPRMVHDLTRKSGKEATFRIQGDSIELDRGILEQMIDPLIHLLRNAIDHGLESPEERRASGKPATGNLLLEITRKADQVLLEVRDDGRGMDPERIRTKAIEQGLLDAQQADDLPMDDLLLLVCAPGFSTSATVTELSGRGVGMDVVSNTVHATGGRLTIASVPGQGTSITLSLPTSVAIIHSLLVACGDLQLAVPVTSVTSIREVPRHTIRQQGNSYHLLDDSRQTPLRNLPGFIHQAAGLPDGDLMTVLMTESNKQPVGLLVNRLLGQQEIFARPLQPPLSAIQELAGSCLLGNGQIVFIVDPAACAARCLREN